MIGYTTRRDAIGATDSITFLHQPLSCTNAWNGPPRQSANPGEQPRIEELLELSHHSLVQYRLPTTGEIVPLLQIAPSKTDTERLLVVSPELAEVLSTIISRIREPSGPVPLIPAYDWHECVWMPPAPLLFQRRLRTDRRAITHSTARNMLKAALASTGLVDPGDGHPLNYTPHDFRRMFITEAVMNGLPPHIAQVIVSGTGTSTSLSATTLPLQKGRRAQHSRVAAVRRAFQPRYLCTSQTQYMRRQLKHAGLSTHVIQGPQCTGSVCRARSPGS